MSPGETRERREKKEVPRWLRRPPPLFEALLRVALPSGAAGESVKGDLDQEHRERQLANPMRSHRAWYAWEALKRGVLYGLGRRVGAGVAGERRRPWRSWKPGLGRSGEIRFAVRRLFKSPGQASFAVLSIALGVGATSTMFCLTHAGLQKMPFPEPDRLLVFYWDRPTGGPRHIGMTVQEVAEWRQAQSTLQGLAGYVETVMNLSDSEEVPERLGGTQITANTFALLGTHPFLGRGFSPDEERPGSQGVAIISHDVWSRRYGADPEVLGRSVRIDGLDRTIVGVMPAGFRWPEQHDLWIPLEIDPGDRRWVGVRGITMFGRLEDGVTANEARTEFALLAGQSKLAAPDLYEGLTLRTVSYYDYEIGKDAVVILLGMLVVVSLVLVIACATVANLLLAQAAGRTRELAVKAALGAARSVLMWQVLAESLVICVIGGLLGVALTYIGAALVQRGMGAEMPYYWMVVEVDRTVLMFVLLLVLLSGLVAGLVPAIRASKVDVFDTLKDETHASTGLRLGRLSRSLVVGEVAFSCCLLIVAGLTAKAPAAWRQRDPGFERGRIFTGRISLRSDVYPGAVAWRRFQVDLLERLEALPGVLHAALTTSLPGTSAGKWSFQLPGATYEREQDLPLSRIRVVTPEYFTTVGVAPLEGRAFLASDDGEAEPVIVVNRPFAERFFPGESALGHRIRTGGLESQDPWRTVVGVVPDLTMNGMEPRLTEGFYLPMSQRPQRNLSILLETSGDPLAAAPDARRTVVAIDSDLPVYNVNSLERELARNMGAAYTASALLVVSGVAALLLAGVGLFGVLAFSVKCRVREIGIRIALGAAAGRVLWMTLWDGMLRVGMGLVVGMCLALLCAPVLREIFSETNPADWTVYALVAGVLSVTGAGASILPALRTVAVDPVRTLRSE